MEKNLENKIANKQNPYKLKGIEKIPALGHLRYMNRLDIEGHNINPEEGTEEFRIMEKSLEYHTISSSLIVLGGLAYLWLG